LLPNEGFGFKYKQLFREAVVAWLRMRNLDCYLVLFLTYRYVRHVNVHAIQDELYRAMVLREQCQYIKEGGGD